MMSRKIVGIGLVYVCLAVIVHTWEVARRVHTSGFSWNALVPESWHESWLLLGGTGALMALAAGIDLRRKAKRRSDSTPIGPRDP